jgi:cytochrome c-type biogenesis protein CcmH
MILPLLLAVITFAALLPIVLPLLRGGKAEAEPVRFDRAVYRDQLQELDRDIARGLLNEAEAKTARLEIQRRLLAADAAPVRATRSVRSPILAGIVSLAGAGGAVAMYLLIGAPEIPSVPAGGRVATDAASPHGGGDADMMQAAQRLAAKLKDNPDDTNGWLLYGRTSMLLGQWDRAVDAYRHALNLGATRPEVVAAYGESLVMQAGGVVTPDALEAFGKALKDSPKLDVARYYIALGVAQGGEAKHAIGMWQDLLKDLAEDNPEREDVIARMTETAKEAGLPAPVPEKGPPAQVKGPDEDTVAAAAAMPEGDRKAFIGSMVTRLAERLKEQPNDLDGWLRLGRAYVVMKELDKAEDALERAMALRPGDTSVKLQALNTVLSEVDPQDPFPPRVTGWLRQLRTEAPDDPVVLWYGGVMDARAGNTAAARKAWEMLLPKLPEGGEDAKMVKTALETLPK